MMNSKNIKEMEPKALHDTDFSCELLKANIQRLNYIGNGLRDSCPTADGDQDFWIETVLFFLPFIAEELNGVLEDLARKSDIKEEVSNG